MHFPRGCNWQRFPGMCALPHGPKNGLGASSPHDHLDTRVLKYTILPRPGILTIQASGKLGDNDLARLSAAAGAYLQEHEHLQGLLVRTQKFPDWVGMVGLATHVEFAHAHRDRVKRVALVTDHPAVDLVATMVKRLSPAKVRHFAYADRAVALAWLKVGTSAAALRADPR